MQSMNERKKAQKEYYTNYIQYRQCDEANEMLKFVKDAEEKNKVSIKEKNEIINNLYSDIQNIIQLKKNCEKEKVVIENKLVDMVELKEKKENEKEKYKTEISNLDNRINEIINLKNECEREQQQQQRQQPQQQQQQQQQQQPKKEDKKQEEGPCLSKDINIKDIPFLNKKAYFKLARLLHPDKNLGCPEEATKKFQYLNNKWKRGGEYNMNDDTMDVECNEIEIHRIVNEIKKTQETIEEYDLVIIDRNNEIREKKEILKKETKLFEDCKKTIEDIKNQMKTKEEKMRKLDADIKQLKNEIEEKKKILEKEKKLYNECNSRKKGGKKSRRQKKQKKQRKNQTMRKV